MSLIEETLGNAGYTAFANALSASPYSEVLDGGGPFTVFAPTDAAFAMFSSDALDSLLHGDEALMRAVIGYHFAAGRVSSARFKGKRIRAVMYAGGDVIIDGKNGLRVNKANLTAPDLVAGNCVIHGIDGVLWPRQQERAV
jgi:uncharacterized surface protein with fasciclin (FAS1) repeats